MRHERKRVQWSEAKLFPNRRSIKLLNTYTEYINVGCFCVGHAYWTFTIKGVLFPTNYANFVFNHYLLWKIKSVIGTMMSQQPKKKHVHIFPFRWNQEKCASLPKSVSICDVQAMCFPLTCNRISFRKLHIWNIEHICRIYKFGLHSYMRLYYMMHFTIAYNAIRMVLSCGIKFERNRKPCERMMAVWVSGL